MTDPIKELFDEVWKKQQAVIEAVMLDFVYTMDRWPTRRIDFVPMPFDKDARPPIFETTIECLKWHRIRVRLEPLGFDIVTYFRLT